MAKKNGLNGWLQRVRRTGEYSDVVVSVNGREFRLHMLPLQNASAYFRNLPSTSDSGTQVHEPTGCKLVTIHHLPGGVEGFAIAADLCYLLKPTFTLTNVALVHAAAEFLTMDDITDATKKFMHANIFSHWRCSTAFLQSYPRTSATVDEYVELRCQKAIVTACVKSFSQTKHISAPSTYTSGPLTAKLPASAGQTLTELLVAVCSMPDRYAAEIVNTLVDSDVNLSLKCRQGRGVRGWLESVLEDECDSDRARCWVLLCLSRMLLKNAPGRRPWLELSSQYWCSLLEQIDLLPLLDDPPLKNDHSFGRKADCASGSANPEDHSQSYIKERLMGVKAILEEKIGESMDEMDEYLRDYKFTPETLTSLVDYYVSMGADAHTPQALEEIASDVDRFLYVYTGEGSITPEAFLTLFKAFPASARTSHDTVYGAIERLTDTGTDTDTDSSGAVDVDSSSCSHTDQHLLWSLIDPGKLSPTLNERALNNPLFLSQPEILESVLQHHSQELSLVDDSDGRHLRHIMHKVINASLKLLEENSRRSREILELQKQYGELLGCRSQMLDHEGIVDLLRRHSLDLIPGHASGGSLLMMNEMEESSESISDSPPLPTSLTTASNSKLGMLPWRSSSVREIRLDAHPT